MVCPVCGERLRTIERSGIEIDVCPGCKGIWLDRGELEKLLALERGDAPQDTRDIREQPVRAQDTRSDDNEHDRDRRRHDDHDDDEHDDRRYDRSSEQNRSGRRRGSWLGDILGSFGGGDD